MVKLLSLTLLAQFVFTSAAYSGSDYEAQLNHRMPSFISSMSKIQKIDQSIELELTYLTKEENHAKAFVSELGSNSTYKKGKWLSYNFKIFATFTINPQVHDMRQWLRKYFFLGIAYHSDLDGWKIKN